MTTRPELDRKVLAAVERLGRAQRAARQQAATDHDLSVLQVQVLELLADGYARRVGDIADHLGVTQPTVSGALSSLERKRMISRRRLSGDGRVVEVALTDIGATCAATIDSELEPLVGGPRSTSERDEATTLRVLLEEITRLHGRGVIAVNRSCLTCAHFRPQPRGGGRCQFLDRLLRDRDLRVDCREHRSASSPA